MRSDLGSSWDEHTVCCRADRLWVFRSSQPVVGYRGEPWEVLFIWLYLTCVECKVAVERVSVRQQVFNCGNASKPTFETTSLDLRSNSICCIVFPFNKMLGKSVLKQTVSFLHWAVSGFGAVKCLSSLELILDRYDSENCALISVFLKICQ